jgi:hypothetical protein
MEKTMQGKVTQLAVLHRVETSDDTHQCSLAKQSCILLITSNSQLTQPVMDYTVNVADRMNCKVLVAYVNTPAFLGSDDQHRRILLSTSARNATEFKEKAVTRGVIFEYVQESGKISKIISRLCQIVKRVEFVLIDQGIKIEEAVSGSPVPVFNIVCTDSRTGKTIGNRQFKNHLNGEKIMKATSRKSHFLKTLIFGVMTAAFYAAVFSNSDLIMKYFTKGGMYTLLPVATVFAFSYAHGSFTSHFWSALGIEGSKGTAQTTVKPAKIAEKRPDTRPRVQAGA